MALYGILPEIYFDCPLRAESTYLAFIPMISTNGIVRKIRLGDDISTYCGRCKDDRIHQVVALNGSATPDRVICRTCGSDHKFRAVKTTEKRTTTRQPRASSRRSVEDDIPTGPIQGYSPKEIFAAGTFISHPKFGTGKVVDARDGKIDVRFGTEIRTLLHAG